MKNTYTIRKWNLYQEFYEVEAEDYEEALKKLNEAPEDYKSDMKFQDTEGEPELIKTDWGDDDFEEGLKDILSKPVPTTEELKKYIGKGEKNVEDEFAKNYSDSVKNNKGENNESVEGLTD